MSADSAVAKDVLAAQIRTFLENGAGHEFTLKEICEALGEGTWHLRVIAIMKPMISRRTIRSRRVGKSLMYRWGDGLPVDDETTSKLADLEQRVELLERVIANVLGPKDGTKTQRNDTSAALQFEHDLTGQTPRG